MGRLMSFSVSNPVSDINSLLSLEPAEGRRSNPEGQVDAGDQRAANGANGQGHDRQTDGCDRHVYWLREWRTLQAGGLDDHGSASDRRAMMRELQNKIADIPAETLSGLRAQAELISELAWNDVVARTARQLSAGLKRLDPKTGG